MARLVLHIGTHKTGTTAIQRTLACNRTTLAHRGIIYPEFATRHDPAPAGDAGPEAYVPRLSDGHHGLLTDWVDLPAKHKTTVPPADLLRQLCRDHADSDRTVLLSSEEFSRARSQIRAEGPDLARLRQYLDGFDDVRVVCLLRHQVPFLQSLYTEVSRKLPPPPVPALVERALETGISVGMFMDFNRLLDRLQAAFPRDRLCFVDYANARQHPGGVLGAMLGAAGVNDLSAPLDQPGGGRANVSDPPLAVWLGNQVTAPDPTPAGLRHLIEVQLRDAFGANRKTTLFQRSEIQRMQSHFAPLNRAFEDRINRDHPQGAPFRLSVPGFDDTVHRDDLRPRHWLGLSRAVYRHRAAG